MCIDKYTKIKILIGKDDKGKECICNYDNPNCPSGYKGNCEEVDCLIDKFSNLEECFSNRYIEKAKYDK